MMFVGQIAIKKGMFANTEDLMAYIFVTHPSNYKDTFFDPDVTEWEGGENAVIIQPGGACTYKVKPVKEGPTLFDELDRSKEYIPIIESAKDPEYLTSEEYRNLADEQKEEYFACIDTNKIGGIPNFFRGDEWPEGKWRLLLQLKCSFLPFVLRLGDMPVMFVFVSEDCRSAGLLIQD